MINYIKRKDLEVDKYDACIENSIQSRIYAFSWYLDIVADNWDVLVLNDYEAVMPIPWKQKYFLKYVTQPCFCQQLGVFSKKTITKETQEKIQKSISKKFVKVSLNFNSDNFFTLKATLKNNYILSINTAYNKLFNSFSKRRKRSIKKADKNNLKIKETSILNLIKIKKEFYSHINFPKHIIEDIANYALNNNKGFILGVFKDEVLLGGTFFLKSNNRIIYLFSANTSEGKKQQASSFLISNTIKQYEKSDFILDFEGSNIPNLASFFESFGAKNEKYHHVNYMNLLKPIL